MKLSKVDISQLDKNVRYVLNKLPARVRTAFVNRRIDEGALHTWMIVARMGKVASSGACPASDASIAIFRGEPGLRDMVAKEIAMLLREGLLAVEYVPVDDGSVEGVLIARYDRMLTVPFSYSWDLAPFPFED